MNAFGQLVSKYQDRVYNACWRLCGHSEDARDLTQEAFLRAYRSLDSFRGHSAFYTWIFRITVNLALSHRRKARVRQAKSLDADRGADQESSPLRDRLEDRNAPSPDQRLTDAELHQRAEQALEALDPNHRAVVVLRDVEGFDYAEIAQMLDIAPGTVKSRLHRARAALRAEFE
ncbi:MAG: sigma-70 family RNA polymerase sigma factor [bacterium]|nr:sigma-70 family RNA polymerase sigma factor [bacterium]